MTQDDLDASQLAQGLGDQYQIVRALGRGAFGAVYLAREVQLHRLVAIKVLHRDRSAIDGQREQFLREARTIAQLSHPGLVSLLAFGETPDSLYMVMPFVSGESLASTLRRDGRLDHDTVRRILIETTDALAYAHAHGVLHRDIKPENILLESQSPGDETPPRVRIIDFGVAAFPTRDAGVGATNEVWGTPDFMAPEQAFGEPELDPRSEIYSVGVLGALLLGGRLPFDAASVTERLAQQRKGPVIPLAVAAPTAPRDLVDVIERCLRFEPAERWPRMRELRDTLINGAGHSPAADSMALMRNRLRGARPRRATARPAFYGAGTLRGITLGALGADLRHAGRMLRKTPAFSAAVILTLAIGLAATTVVFSMLEALVLRPPPVADPSALVGLEERHDNNHNMQMGATAFSYERYLEYGRTLTTVFSGLAAQTIQDLSYRSDAGTRTVGGVVTSGNYFDVLGVHPAAGRFYGADEDRPGGGASVVVIGYDLWRSAFGGASSVIGRTLVIDSRPMTIIGIAPRGFHGALGGLYALDMWVPAASYRSAPPGRGAQPGGAMSLVVFGRLRPGVTIDQANTALRVAATRIPMEDPSTHVLDAWAEPLHRLTRDSAGTTRTFMTMLLAVAGLVLLIAGSNAAGMLLARGESRRREIATRLAVGGTRVRLVQQLLVESALLCAIAGAVGIGMTAVVMRLFNHMPSPLPWALVAGFGVNVPVVAIALVGVLAAAIVAGVMPAIRATRVDLMSTMKAGGTSTAGHGSRLRDAFVVAQLALSMTVLVVGGLFARSIRRAAEIDPGFDAKGVVVSAVNLRPHGYDEARGRELFDRLGTRLRERPEIASVALGASAPLSGDQRTDDVRDAARPTDKALDSQFSLADAGLLELLHVPLLAGRTFGPADGPDAPPVAVINAALAHRLWPSRALTDVLGQAITLGGRRRTVIGVCGNGKYLMLQEGVSPFVYVPLQQRYASSVTLFLRGRRDAATTLRVAREELAALDPNVALERQGPLQQWVDKYVVGQRVAASIVAVFGLIGLALSAAGIFAVLAFSVAQRSRELAVRVALGATRADVVRLVLQHTVALLAAGLVIGSIGALIVGRLVASYLFGLSSADPITFIGVPVILALAALVASIVPLRRATSSDPMLALRAE